MCSKWEQKRYISQMQYEEMMCERRGNRGSKVGVRTKTCSVLSTPTPLFEYSHLRFSKKFVFPLRLIMSIHSNGLLVFKGLRQPRAHRRRLEQNLMQSHIMDEYIPISSLGRAFDVDCTTDDVDDACLGQRIDQFGVHEASKVTIEPFILADELIAEAESRHESVFFEPEDGTERSQEEDAFDGSKFNRAFGKAGIGGITPLTCPVGFALNAQYSLNGVQKVQFLLLVLGVGINQQQVNLAVDVFDGNM